MGGLIGGLIHTRGPKATPEYEALSKIEVNSRETFQAVVAQTQMLSLGNRLFNVPASFTVPKYAIQGGGGSANVSAGGHSFTFNISGASNPQAVASAVVAKIQTELRTQGSYVSSRGSRN